MKNATGSPGFGGQRRLSGGPKVKAIKGDKKVRKPGAVYSVPRSATFSERKSYGMPKNSTFLKGSKKKK